MGVSICPMSSNLARRVTSATPITKASPKNLTVKTEAQVNRIIFDGTKAIGVRLADGAKCEFQNRKDNFR
jgi:choline dehydrogenase-like flavoprotein